MNLKKLVIGSISNDFVRKLNSIAMVVDAFKGTLVELGLPDEAWQLEEMKSIHCPKLRRLRLVVSAHEDYSVTQAALDVIQAFVQSQPLLEELTVQCPTYEFGDLFEKFRGRLSEIRKLRVRCENEYFVNLDGAPDYSFLKEMTKLQEFHICSDPFYYGSGSQMLDSVSPSLKKLTLMDSACGYHDQRWFDFYGCIIGDHLKRFRNLTHMNLLGCRDDLNDVGMQTVIKNCPHLMELAFGDTENLTDFGISGVHGNEDGAEGQEPGVPLSDLKGLVQLTIKSCKKLTEACVCSVLRFQYLRLFAFHASPGQKKQGKDEFLSLARKQCPQLEHLWVFSDGFFVWPSESESGRAEKWKYYYAWDYDKNSWL